MASALGHSRLVVHVITSIARGGAENHLVDLIQGQLDSGWTVKVAFLKSFGDRYWKSHLESLGVETCDLELTRYGDWRPVNILRAFLDRVSPDLVHAHMPPAEIYTRLALARRKLPLIISKHNDKPFLRNMSGGVLERWCASRAKSVIGISSAVSRYFAGRWPDSLSDRIVTVRYGLDPVPYQAVTGAEIAALRSEWGVKPDEILVGTVARLNVQKALDVMLGGFALAVAANPDAGLKLVLVGQGELEADLRRLTAELGLSDRVIFAGFRTDIPAVMRSLDIFALTSNFEGFGLVLLEAMSAGRPILATGVSAIPEVVADGVTGLLVPRQDRQAFADALGRLLDPEMRTRLGDAGVTRVRDEFQLSVMVRRTLEIYDGALAVHGA
jgi:glycosyltransferase involved in cell wall biosynthesis